MNEAGSAALAAPKLSKEGTAKAVLPKHEGVDLDFYLREFAVQRF